jgi:hypothetical protein
MILTTVASGLRRGAMHLTLSAALTALAAPVLLAQGQSASRPVRLTAISGGLVHGSALVVDPAGQNDTRLDPGATFGLELQYGMFSSGSLYAGVAGSFSTLEHGANLGIVAGTGSSSVTIFLGTAGLVLEASDWFANVRPTLRLGGGIKAYSFTASGASSSTAFTGDIGAGFRAGAGAIEVLTEVRYLPSAFDQAKLPLRGQSPQDQRQNDLLFTIGVTVKP